jgi:hypothetical protein
MGMGVGESESWEDDVWINTRSMAINGVFGENLQSGILECNKEVGFEFAQ